MFCLSSISGYGIRDGVEIPIYNMNSSSNHAINVNARALCAPNVVGQFLSRIFLCTLAFPLELLFLA